MSQMSDFTRIIACAAVVAGLLGAPAQAYGPAGHRIAGRVAEPLLCRPAAAELAALGDGESLAEIGLWADRIRGEEAWQHTGPWHYMNIEDGAAIDSFEHPPEGDVLRAIERHAARVAAGGPEAERARALRFLVHFVVDIHQPLHVGREADRGGNAIDVRFDGTTVNLHRFWDTDAIALARLGEAEYADAVRPLARMFSAAARFEPSAWAEESLALRPAVYAFDAPTRRAAVLDERYLERADVVTRVRLAQAAARLAATLNAVLAPGGEC